MFFFVFFSLVKWIWLRFNVAANWKQTPARIIYSLQLLLRLLLCLNCPQSVSESSALLNNWYSCDTWLKIQRFALKILFIFLSQNFSLLQKNFADELKRLLNTRSRLNWCPVETMLKRLKEMHDYRLVHNCKRYTTYRYIIYLIIILL